MFFEICNKNFRILLFLTLVNIQKNFENMISSDLEKLSDYQIMLKILQISLIVLQNMHQKLSHDYYYAFSVTFQTSSLDLLDQTITEQKS